MFRQLHDVLTRARTTDTASDHWADLVRETPAPDPYVWRLPSPHEARWRRWARRSLATGHRLPVLQNEDCRHVPPRPRTPVWTTSDAPVRPYVARQSAR